MRRIARGLPPTRRAAGAIPMGHYHRFLVLGRGHVNESFKRRRLLNEA